MLNIGPQELLLILVIALIVVGPHRLPTLGRSIGRGLRELRKAQDEVRRTIQVGLDDEPAKGSPTALGGGGRPRGDGSGDVGPGAGDDPAAAPQDPTPQASEPPAPSEVAEVTRALGKSLGQLRRAREEIRKSFRVDLGEQTPRAAGSGAAPEPEPDGEASDRDPGSGPGPGD